MNSILKTAALLGMGILCAPVFAADAQPARPGTVNYVEGATYLQGKELNPHDVGSIEMNPGQVLTTSTGKAEILLTPGVFLRVDQNSAVKMISPEITPTQVELDHGRAAIEVDEIYKQNDLEITDAGITTHLAKDGYYEFDADHPTAMVFKGEAVVDEGDGRYQNVKAHHELALVEGAPQKPAKFDTNNAQDSLYKWSSLRSQYLAEANNQIAGQYAGMAGFNPGWYWDPYMWNYTFIGGGPYWSPFGFGFYPPWWGGFYGGYYGGGYYGHPIYRGRNAGPGYRGGGFHQGGGFHGGAGGGFHGGGGGGFHGGGGHR
ncbi:MAG TPA: hypothetical protein VH308_14170 [Terracidiphilus sp.]|jgi:hypothetical protein|nr:hypothetical protein [Terracidiphilus sp.]